MILIDYVLWINRKYSNEKQYLIPRLMNFGLWITNTPDANLIPVIDRIGLWITNTPDASDSFESAVCT
jgi:hypothetical protein